MCAQKDRPKTASNSLRHNRLPSAAAFLLLLLAAGPNLARGGDPLEQGFANPPREARLRAYWWWINGFVDRAAITRDLEEMKAKGFGGALICDADGSSQDGNERAPHGPTFFTPEWRELFKHTLREADRLGLEMSLNVQSGWNLGGPMITPEQAPKKLVWSEVRVAGPSKGPVSVLQPGSRDGFYQDVMTVAYRLKGKAGGGLLSGFTASAEQDHHPAAHMADGNPATFWVGGGKPGDGPSRKRPAWVRFEFARPVSVERLTLAPRPNYGPRECEVQASDDGVAFRAVKTFTADAKKPTSVDFPPQQARVFRLLILGANDPLSPQAPRNVQIAEIELKGKDGAWPGAALRRPELESWREKAGHRTLHFSAPDTRPLLVDAPDQPGEEEVRSTDVLDLTSQLKTDGRLDWDAPEGLWQVLRFGCTVSDRGRVSTCSEGWDGYAIDPLDADAFRFYSKAVIEPLLADAGPLCGRALKYLHTDSWEIEPYNWTRTFRAEFEKRRGYDLRPFAPVLVGRIVDSRSASNRFLHDFRRTLGDLAIDNHYRIFRDLAHRHGVQIHPESGGPHSVPIDAQRCLGFNDVPMSEFWAWSWRHRIGDKNRFFVKQPASAAHVYGRRLVAAEGFTTIGPHWQETLADNLKPAFDKACCEGLNLLVWHAVVCSPAAAGVPGVQYFAGTHFNPNTTWWPKSAAFLAYINRCQFLLQQGLFAADVAYYYGDHVPNFAQFKATDPAGILPGYDYDVLTEEALIERATVNSGRITLPDGMSYRALVLADHPSISLPALRKVQELVAGGATVIGAKPQSASGLHNAAQNDAEVQRIAAALWDSGRIASGKTAREVLLAAGVKPDFEAAGGNAETDVDYIHRRDGATEIYFVANRGNRPERLKCTFRVSSKSPELWDPVSGAIRPLPEFNQRDGRTEIPLEFAPCGSWFVIFRAQASPAAPSASKKNFPTYTLVVTLDGPWEVAFDPKWGGPPRAKFDQLDDWSKRSEPGIRHYSGAAIYRRSFDLPSELSDGALTLNLGDVRELAEVRLNGKSLGVVWARPLRVDLPPGLRRQGNQLEIEVVNFWPNRIIGDQSLPEKDRFTHTNIRKLTRDVALMPSGLLGPVAIERRQ